jgi:tRNA (mo5U34)-methyltransferase
MTMTEDEIRTGVQALGPWFHQIDLGHGILTKTRPAATEPLDHPAGTWEIVKNCLPRNLEGRSVLDVGCNAGFYALEAKRRGARRVLGIDAQRQLIRQARFAARALSLDIEYQRMSVYDLNPHWVGRFDVTLALGLIYHCKHPLLALEKLFGVTSDLLILESEVLFPSPSFAPTEQAGDIGRPLHPMAYVENQAAAREAVYNWFIPSVEALKAMLRDVGFIDVELARPPLARAVIVARRPRFEPDSLSMPQLLAAELTLLDGPAKCRPDATMRFRINIRNTGQSIWLAPANTAGNKGAVRLGVHLLDRLGEEIAHDYGGVPIGANIEPGAPVVLEVFIPAPSSAGTYQLEFDMVSEHVTWFEDCSTIPLTHTIAVQ